MHPNLIQQNSIVRLAAFALFVSCLAEPRIYARGSDAAGGRSEPDEVRSVLHTTSWGMVRGQSARISVVNPNEPSERERRTIFIWVVLFDAGGVVIAESDEIAIPPGQSRSVDFHRDAIAQPGEPGSGRLQTRAQVHYRPFSLIDRSNLRIWPTSIELIDDDTGYTTLLVSQKPKGSGIVGPNVTEIPVVVYRGLPLVGLVQGQTLRVTPLYPGDPADPQRRSVQARVRLYDTSGALLAQSAEATLAPGEFRSFDFDRADIPAPGEPAGGRLQMRVSLEVAATDSSSFTQDSKAAGLLVASFEMIDQRTGKTEVLSGQQCLVFFLGGIPNN